MYTNICHKNADRFPDIEMWASWSAFEGVAFFRNENNFPENQSTFAAELLDFQTAETSKANVSSLAKAFNINFRGKINCEFANDSVMVPSRKRHILSYSTILINNISNENDNTWQKSLKIKYKFSQTFYLIHTSTRTSFSHPTKKMSKSKDCLSEFSGNFHKNPPFSDQSWKTYWKMKSDSRVVAKGWGHIKDGPLSEERTPRYAQTRTP